MKRFWVLGFGFRVSGFAFRVSAILLLGFRASADVAAISFDATITTGAYASAPVLTRASGKLIGLAVYNPDMNEGAYEVTNVEIYDAHLQTLLWISGDAGDHTTTTLSATDADLYRTGVPLPGAISVVNRAIEAMDTPVTSRIILYVDTR